MAILHHSVAEWKRPKNIVEKPQFMSSQISRHDIQQTGLVMSIISS